MTGVSLIMGMLPVFTSRFVQGFSLGCSVVSLNGIAFSEAPAPHCDTAAHGERRNEPRFCSVENRRACLARAVHVGVIAAPRRWRGATIRRRFVDPRVPAASGARSVGF